MKGLVGYTLKLEASLRLYSSKKAFRAIHLLAHSQSDRAAKRGCGALLEMLSNLIIWENNQDQAE